MLVRYEVEKFETQRGRLISNNFTPSAVALGVSVPVSCPPLSTTMQKLPWLEVAGMTCAE